MNGVAQLAGDGSAWVNELPQYKKLTDLKTVGSITTIYNGWAAYGSAETSEVWMIQRIILDETTGLDASDLMAGGQVGDFSYRWDQRASHSYS